MSNKHSGWRKSLSVDVAPIPKAEGSTQFQSYTLLTTPHLPELLEDLLPCMIFRKGRNRKNKRKETQDSNSETQQPSKPEEMRASTIQYLWKSVRHLTLCWSKAIGHSSCLAVGRAFSFGDKKQKKNIQEWTIDLRKDLPQFESRVCYLSSNEMRILTEFLENWQVMQQSDNNKFILINIVSYCYHQ